MNSTYAGTDAAVGEIRISLLKPEDFLSLYGSDWRLMDGKEISGLPLAAFLDPSVQAADKRYTIPDARGRFLRMANNGAKGAHYDPEERVPGQLQNAAYPAHKHSVNFGGDGNPNGSGDRNRNGGREYILDPITRSTKYNYTTTSSGSGADNRPDNIAVNFYVKVSCENGGVCQTQEIEE